MKNYLPLLILTLAFSACKKQEPWPETPKDAKDGVAVSTAAFQYDRRATDIARLLAGLDPETKEFDVLLATPAWKAHQEFFRAPWKSMKESRFPAAEKWRAENLTPLTKGSTHLFYPFSGPDFLNAHLFFPDRADYIFYSLEKPGEWPPLASMTPDQFADLLVDVQDSLGDIFRRQYFITKHMDHELRTPYLKGNLPVLGVFMALLDFKIVSVEDIYLSSAGRTERWDKTLNLKSPVRGIKVVFRDPAKDRAQMVYYFSLDVSNKPWAKRPEFKTYLEGWGRAPTFLKSASYLLHDDQFSSVRKTIINTTEVVMQDDTGIPYRFLDKGWDVSLYGKYTKPIKDFNYGFQKDLDKAYAAPGAAKNLPFKFGYHWWDGYSNVQVAVRKKPAPAAKK